MYVDMGTFLAYNTQMMATPAPRRPRAGTKQRGAKKMTSDGCITISVAVDTNDANTLKALPTPTAGAGGRHRARR